MEPRRAAAAPSSAVRVLEMRGCIPGRCALCHLDWKRTRWGVKKRGWGFRMSDTPGLRLQKLECWGIGRQRPPPVHNAPGWSRTPGIPTPYTPPDPRPHLSHALSASPVHDFRSWLLKLFIRGIFHHCSQLWNPTWDIFLEPIMLQIPPKTKVFSPTHFDSYLQSSSSKNTKS